MKTMTATDLKNSPGAFFDALLEDGEVMLTRHGRLIHVIKKLVEPNKGHVTGGAAMGEVLERLGAKIPEDERAEIFEQAVAELSKFRLKVKEGMNDPE